MSELSLSLLGSFQATLDGQPLNHFRTHKVRALLIYLAIEAPTVHQREALMELLWPGLPLQSAQVNLRQIIYQLRRAVPDATGNGHQSPIPLVIGDRATLQLNPDFQLRSDVAAFNDLLRRSRHHAHDDPLACEQCAGWLAEAVAFYDDDFLAGFAVYDSDQFESWAEVKREAYRRQALEALDNLTQIHLAREAFGEAERYARQQLAIDPLRESAYRQLMRILARSGQRGEALALYEKCRERLATELGMTPGVKTTALSEQIRGGDLDAAGPTLTGLRGYELREQIGEGAFGTVHRAWQKSVGREVAVKIIHPRHANAPAFIRRFEAEAQIVAQLEHPHIVPLYDYWREPDGAYLVMRWLRGGSLRDRLAAGPLPLATAVTLIRQIAGALQAAHRHGIVHRDVKPANILLDEEGHAYLTDFGIACDVAERSGAPESETHTTPLYRSPEQLLGEAVTPVSDIYCLGLVLYEMLTGAHPYAATSAVELIRQQMNEPLPSLSSSRPELPGAIDAIVSRATAKRAGDRYASATALADALERLANGRAPAATPAETPAVPEADIINPYKGLHAFQEVDAAHFHGRSALVKRLLERMQPARPGTGDQDAPRDAHRFLALVGPSGSGKSSVVKAGLIPALRRGALPGSERWFIVEMTPGSQPLEELEAALLRVAVNPPASLLEPLQKDARGLARVLRRILPQDPGQENPAQLLLFVDQFEELFTLVEKETERDHFLDLLLTALTDHASRLWLVLTLRADFYDRPLQQPQLGEWLRRRTELLLPMTPVELEEAIVAPSAAMSVTLEPGLAAAIIGDVREQPGALPLMQYALTELFERRQNRQMTLAAYEAIGGVAGALARRADELYTALDPAAQEATRQLFLRLITLGEGAEDTRRRVPLHELQVLAPSSNEPSPTNYPITNFQFPISIFASHRLLTFDRDPISRTPTVEVAHEALLREWGRLRGWLDESRGDVRLERALAHAAADWVAAGRDDSYLLHGARLAHFEGWFAGSSVALTAVERELLDASIAARDRQAAEEEARGARELATARQLAEEQSQRAAEQSRAAQTLRRRALFLAVALFVAAALAVTAFGFARASNANAALAADREAEALANLDLAAANEAQAIANAGLAATREAEAERERDSAEAARQAAIVAQQQAEQEAEFRAAAEAAAVVERDLARSRELAQAATNNLDRDPERSLLLALQALDISDTKEAEEALHLALQRSRVRLTLDHEMDWVARALFHPDGDRVITAGSDGNIRIWDAPSRRLLQSLPFTRGSIYQLAVDPEGAFVQALGRNGAQSTITLARWEVDDGTLVISYTLPITTDDWSGIAVSPDLSLLAVGYDDGRVTLWNVAESESIITFTGHDDWAWGLGFTPDGTSLWLESPNGQVTGWDIPETLASGAEQIIWSDTLTAAPLAYFSNFNREGTKTIVTYFTGLVEVRSLDTSSPRAEASFMHGNVFVDTAAWHPQGHLVATGGQDGLVRVWDVATAQELVTLAGHQGSISSVAFSADGSLLISGGHDGMARIWDVTAVGGGELLAFAGPELATWVTLNPDGRWLAAGNRGGPAIVYDAESGEPRLTLAGEEGTAVYNIAFSPDGERIAAVGEDNVIRIRDAASGELLLSWTGHGEGDSGGLFFGTIGVAFSPDGRRLATAGADGIGKVWDAATGAELLILEGHTDGLFGITFSPDGAFLATASDVQDATIKLWDAATGEALHTLTGHPVRVIDLAFSPDSRLLATAGWAGVVKVWDVASGGELYTLPDQVSTVQGVAFTPDGQRLLTSGGDAVRVWDVATGTELVTLAPGSGFAALSGDGRHLYLATDGAIRVFLLNLEDSVALAHDRLTRPLTADECRQYLRLAACPAQ